MATPCLGRGSGQGPSGASWTEKKPTTGEAPLLSGGLQEILSEKDRTTGLQGTDPRNVGPRGIEACFSPA